MPPIAFTYECDGKTTLNSLGVNAPIPYPARNKSRNMKTNAGRFLKGFW